ncbi:MAG: phosphatase PAP2 family protein [Polyangiales bacterium]
MTVARAWLWATALSALVASRAEAQPVPRWQYATRIDRDASRVLRAEDPRTRRAADTASWVVVGTLMAAPIAVAEGAALDRGASQLAVGEAVLSLAIPYASTALIGFGAKYLFARERPYAARAGLASRCADGAASRRGECDWDRNGSFPSLHSALGFAAAGALCVQSLRFAPSGTSDALACGAATFSATIGAMLRMVADKHYVTDVLVGSLLGLTLSVATSWALHFAPGAPIPLARALDAERVDPLPVVLGAGAGVALGALTLTTLSAQWRASW